MKQKIYKVILSAILLLTADKSMAGVNRIGGTSADQSNAIAIDASGNQYITGGFQGTVDFDPGVGTVDRTSAGSNDAYVAKYDASGNYVWVVVIGSLGADAGASLTVDASGNVYVTGVFNNAADFDPGAGTVTLTPVGSADMFFAKYDASGNYVLAKNIGGTGSDAGNSIAVDASGNIYLTGSFSSTADFDPGAGTANLISAGGTDIFCAKYDASGTYVWAVSIGGTLSDDGNSIAVDASGNIYIAGGFQGAATDFDPGAGTDSHDASTGAAFLIKLDGSGAYTWGKNVGNIGNSIKVDGSGNVYVAGYFNGTKDFDPSGSTANLSSAGSNDIFVGKYDASGAYVWAKKMGGTGDDQGLEMVLDASANVYTTGYFNGTADFDPGAGTANLTSFGGDDIFISKLDASGNYVSSGQMGGDASDQGNGIAIASAGNILLTGCYASTTSIDFDPGAGTVSPGATAGSFDIFMLEMSSSFSLPLQLSSFNASASGSQALLRWSTASERDMAYMDIERSNDGTGFEAIGRLACKGNNSSEPENKYSFTDIQPYAGSNYYRLKMYELSGKISYSPVELVHMDATGPGPEVYPTANTGGVVYVRYSGAEAATPQIELYNMLGQAVPFTTRDIRQGITELNFTDQVPGLCLLRVVAEGKEYVHKVAR